MTEEKLKIKIPREKEIKNVIVLESEENNQKRSVFGLDGIVFKICSLFSPLLILVLWELLSKLGILDIRLFSTPSLILKSMLPVVISGELFYNTFISIRRIVLGFLAGAIPGVIVGLSMGLFPLIRLVFQPIVSAVFPIPKLAIMPLILLVFGLGEVSKIFVIAMGVFFLVVINTMAGVLNIEQIYLDVAKNYGASRKDFYLTVALPGALPMIFAGFKVAMGTALLLIVAAELSAARAGIGYMIWRAYDMFDIERMFVALIMMSVLGYVFSFVIDWIERLAIPWKHN